MDFYFGRLSRSEDKLMCHFKLAADMIGGVASGNLCIMQMDQQSW